MTNIRQLRHQLVESRKNRMAGGGIWSTLGKVNNYIKDKAIFSKGLGYLGDFTGPTPLGLLANAGSKVASHFGYGRRRRYRRRAKMVGTGRKKRRIAKI